MFNIGSLSLGKSSFEIGPTEFKTKVLNNGNQNRLNFLRTSIKGINVYPPYGNWTASQGGLNEERSNALKFAGYNSQRCWVDFNQLMSSQETGANPNFQTAVNLAISRIQNVTSDGYRAIVATDLSDVTRLSVMQPSSIPNTRFHMAWQALATAISTNFTPTQVALEIMNEPPTASNIAASGFPSYADVFAPAVFSTIRNAAPNFWIGIGSTDLQFVGTITDLDPSNFDDKTFYALHGYDPGEYSHQGQLHLYPHLHSLPWPVSSYSGGITQAKADMAARVNADGTLSSGQKTTLIASNNSRLDFLFGGGGQKSYYTNHLDDIADWCVTHNIDPKRVICTEFGVVSNFNHDNTPGTTLEARVAYERDWRIELEARGFGWMVYQALGDLQHFEQTSVSNQSNRLIVELTEALGLRAPTPSIINDLSIGNMNVSSLTLNFINSLDATSYEYRLNDGPHIVLPNNKTVSALDADTEYTIQVRGKNASAVGEWSNSVVGTTLEIPSAPTWVQSYNIGNGNPSFVAEFDNNRYWVSNVDGTFVNDVATVSRSTEKFAITSNNNWQRFNTNTLARTNLGLSVEAAISNYALTIVKVPSVASGPSTSFPTGLQNFGATTGYTCSIVEDGTSISNSGLSDLVPLNLVYEISNTSGSMKYLQFGGTGGITSSPQVGSWFARKISGSGNIQLGKSSGGGTNKQLVPISTNYSRFTFTDSGTNAMELSIPNNTVFRFVVPILEYKTSIPASSPIVASSRTKDSVTLSTAAQNAVNQAETIRIDIGSGLTNINATSLMSILDGGNVIIKKLLTY